MSPTSTMPTDASGGGAHGISRDGYAKAAVHELKSSDLEGAKVHGRDDETIGSVSTLTLGAEGRIDAAVIDVGGFLGIGAHSVLVPFDDLTVLRATDGSDVRVHMDTTKDKLKAMPQHHG
ncbi:PRC-barrel domain-containing protein [Rhodobaculum claviforme]|uniref:PRC-barrel domain-containing protein n=1 Tax=Rhodobaculum claviforme TaxID=1549854 RepID=A0A934TJD1_9RHOB|nr:PRC-barrel domain-containing protein [Rhodobaculum claviforme]MBK5926561.1 hypothetical protein [Rhodobaculum claviforme]